MVIPELALKWLNAFLLSWLYIGRELFDSASAVLLKLLQFLA
jgi:hypothetical protein